MLTVITFFLFVSALFVLFEVHEKKKITAVSNRNIFFTMFIFFICVLNKHQMTNIVLAVKFIKLF